jgi:hypothetical protein
MRLPSSRYHFFEFPASLRHATGVVLGTKIGRALSSGIKSPPATEVRILAHLARRFGQGEADSFEAGIYEGHIEVKRLVIVIETGVASADFIAQIGISPV